MQIIDEEGNVIQEFDSITVAAEYAGIVCPNSIGLSIKKGHKAGGYRWKYSDDEYGKVDVNDTKKWMSPPNYSQYLVSKNGDIYTKKYNRPIQPTNNRFGATDDNGKRTNILVHVFVMMTYCPKPETDGEELYIKHKNCDNSDNRLSNLEWDNQSKINKHVNRTTGKIGQRKVCKYSLQGQFIKEFNSIAEAAEDGGCARPTIRKSCIGESKKAVGFIWLYKEDSIEERLKIMY